MAFTSSVRSWWDYRRCSIGQPRPTGFFGRHTVWQQPELADAITALEAGHIESGYVPDSDGYIGSVRSCPHGIAGARCQPSGSGCSLHNYVIAYDIEYNYNRHIKAKTYAEDFGAWWFPAVCKYTLAQVRAIEGIKNIEGEQMWRWLGWAIGDFMHWQINVPPSRTTVDWNTVPTEKVETTMNLHALARAAFRVPNPKVTGDVNHWLRLADSDPESDEWEDLFFAMLMPVVKVDHEHPTYDHEHPRVPHQHAVAAHTHTGTVEVS